MTSYKIVLVGDADVGKSTFSKRCRSGEFTHEYNPTWGTDVHPLEIKTNKGDFTLNIWDVAGDENRWGLRDGYFLGMDAAIIMCSASDKGTQTSVPTWHRDLMRVHDVPVTLVYNKCDTNTGREDTVRAGPRGTMCHKVSAKTGNNLQAPFVHLLRTLTGDNGLTLRA